MLIAITVALAAVVATLVSGLGGRGTPPSAMLTVTAENDAGTLKLTIEHQGGDDLVLSDLEVDAGSSTPLAENADLGSGTFSVGATKAVLVTGASFTEGEVVTVYIIHVPSKQKIFSSNTVVVQT